jgi:hypothetical protein
VETLSDEVLRIIKTLNVSSVNKEEVFYYCIYVYWKKHRYDHSDDMKNVHKKLNELYFSIHQHLVVSPLV